MKLCAVGDISGSLERGGETVEEKPHHQRHTDRGGRTYVGKVTQEEEILLYFKSTPDFLRIPESEENLLYTAPASFYPPYSIPPSCF